MTAQSLWDLECRFEYEDLENPAPSEALADCDQHSINGHTLPASGVIRLLVVFAQVQYADASFDPNPNTNTEWPLNSLPVWANDLFDSQPLAVPQGKITKYYHDASSGNYTVLGDILMAPGAGIFTIPNADHLVSHTHLIQAVNAQSNGVFTTHNQLTVADFDMWQKTFTGQPKVNLPDSPHRYDCVMFIWRNRRNWYGSVDANGNPIYTEYHGTGNADPFGFSQIMLGHVADTYMNFGTHHNIPVDVARHEFAHLIMGGNNFHCAGGGNQINYWIPHTGGHSMLGLAGSALRCWNAWDRYWFGWKPTANSFEISARNASGAEMNGDLDATMPSHAGTYILRDFVTTGDALRIKLPFLNSGTEYQQWLWLENHRGINHNGNEFDAFRFQGNSCVDPVEWGLSVSVQIDRENRCGSNIYLAGSFSSNASHADHVRMISADGMWEREFDVPLSLDPCVWGLSNYPSEKISQNPLTGFSDLDRHPYDFNNNGTLVQADQKLVYAEQEGSTTNWKLYLHGNPRQFFRTGENDRLAISTNPPSNSRMNLVGFDSPLTNFKNVRKIYLNGIQLKVIDMLPNGDIKVEVKFDHVDIDQDVRWCAPDIVLNQIPTTHGYSLVVKQDRVLTLDHGTAATKMSQAISFEGQQVFTSPTTMRARAGAQINLEQGSELLIDRKSRLVLESGSTLFVQAGAVLRIRREGVLAIEDGAVLQVENGGEVIIEEASSPYGRGKLEYYPNARINLEGSNAIIDLSGELALQDGAAFTLANTTSTLRTNGKIIFRPSTSTEVTAGTNTSMGILGYAAQQETIINQKLNMQFPANLTAFVIRDLRISQFPLCVFVPPLSNSCDITFRDVTLTAPSISQSGHFGLRLNGQELVTLKDCSFSLGVVCIDAFNIALGNGLTINSCIFSECEYGLISYSKNIIIKDSEFKACNRDWSASAMTGTSGMQNVVAGNTAQNNNVTFRGNAVLLAEGNTVKGGTHGFELDVATGRFQCNTITNHPVSAFYVINGGGLVMNGSWQRNNCTQNTRTILVNEAGVLNLNNGVNDLRPNSFGTQSVVNGTMICPSAGHLNANSNLWNNAGTAPPQADYSITGLCQPNPVNILLNDNTPIGQYGPCLSGDGEGLGIMELGSTFAEGETEEGEIDSNNLAATLLGVLQAHDTSPFQQTFFASTDDVQPDLFILAENFVVDVELNNYLALKDILTTPGAYELTGAPLYFTASKALLESHLRLLHLNANDTYSNLSEAVDVQTNSLQEIYANVSSTLALNGHDDLAFYSTVNEVEAYRLEGQLQSAITLLEGASYPPVTEVQEALKARLLCELNFELELSTMDLADMVQATNPCSTSEAADEAKSQPSGEENSGKAVDSKPQLLIKPNPASHIIFISLERDAHTTYTLELYNATGSLVYREVPMGTGEVQVGSFPAGLYVARLLNGFGQVKSARFIITK